MSRPLDVAYPADSDLTCHIRGLTLTAIVRANDEHEVLIRGVGGTGFWDGRRVRNVTSLEGRCRMPGMADDLWEVFVGRLERWRDQGVPLQMCAARGRFTALHDPHGGWVPMPKRPERARR